jgi:proline iminopeptidase
MKIAVNDVELFFDVEGPKVVASGDEWVERPTVVLLHAGPGADHSLYKDLVGPQLASVAQVVYLDQRGDGRSSRSDASHWNLDTWSDDLRAFLDALEIERPVLLGSAIGSLVALSFASRYPERTAGLVLVSAVARYVHQRSVSEFDRLGGAHAGEVAARYFGDPTEATFADYMNVCLPLYTRHPLDPDVVARMRINPEGTVNWTRAEAGKLDLRGAVGRITCPVLLFAGEDDPSFTLAGAEELAASLPAGRTTFRRIPSAGHGVFRDAPWALDEAAEFIRASASVRSEGDDGALVGFS